MLVARLSFFLCRVLILRYRFLLSSEYRLLISPSGDSSRLLLLGCLDALSFGWPNLTATWSSNLIVSSLRVDLGISVPKAGVIAV